MPIYRFKPIFLDCAKAIRKCLLRNAVSIRSVDNIRRHFQLETFKREGLSKSDYLDRRETETIQVIALIFKVESRKGAFHFFEVQFASRNAFACK